MANRYKKTNGARETVIEGEYRRRYADDDILDRHRRRYYSDPAYREHRGGGDQPARPPAKREFTVPLDPKDAERLRKLADRDKLQQKIARNLFNAGRVVNPLLKAHSIYDAFEPILKDIRFDFGNGFSFSETGGVELEGPLANTYVLKCSNPLVQPVDTYGAFSGHNNATTCGLSGQAQPNGWRNLVPTLEQGFLPMTGNATRTVIYSRGYLVAGVVERKQYAKVYWQTAQAGLPTNNSYIRVYTHKLTPDFNAMENPNFMRSRPGEPAPSPNRLADPVGDYVNRLDEAAQRNPRGAVRIRSGGAGGGGRITISPAKPGPPAPPRPRTKERKALSTMRTVLTVLDHISEGAEVVDAMYEALPKKVQRKWKCGGAGRGLIDSAGQYGIDKADCKLRALWHNWWKMDVEQAVKNIIANEIQDRVIGGIARASPVNTGRATDEAQKKVNELLERLFKEIGLKPNEERT